MHRYLNVELIKFKVMKNRVYQTELQGYTVFCATDAKGNGQVVADIDGKMTVIIESLNSEPNFEKSQRWVKSYDKRMVNSKGNYWKEFNRYTSENVPIFQTTCSNYINNELTWIVNYSLKCILGTATENNKKALKIQNGIEINRNIIC